MSDHPGSEPHYGEQESPSNGRREPIEPVLPPDTPVAREGFVTQFPEWVVDRLSATALMLVILAIILGVGGFLLWFVLNFRFW